MGSYSESQIIIPIGKDIMYTVCTYICMYMIYMLSLVEYSPNSDFPACELLYSLIANTLNKVHCAHLVAEWVSFLQEC